MKYFKKLEGPRLYLSPVNPEDVETYTRWINDLSVSLRLGASREVFGLPREQSLLDDMAKEGQNFAIVLHNQDQLIGNCSLFAIDHIRRVAEVGIFVGDDEQRGQGYGTEALQLICEYGFKILNLNNIMLRVFEFNQPAIRCYEKAGFRVFGRRTQSYYVNDIYYDEIYMEMLRNDLATKYLDAKLPNRN
ncbi:GNAT family N-acetyltransferase [Paenibacillus macerans]|uniref:GNAT family N-acetyltransferase n=1 Tax=Paenibacillus macerans TaxID=44252 RepID=UPI003D320E6F